MTRAFMVEAITEFNMRYRWLSNFYNCKIYMPDGIFYPSSEHAYQAYKTDDKEARMAMARNSSCVAAKRWGKSFQARSDWDMIKIAHMLNVVRVKFEQNENLAARLRATGLRTLVEGNTWGDTFWGVYEGDGLNMLGVVLMTVRSELFMAGGGI